MEDGKSKLLLALAQLAWADGEVAEEETEMITRMADRIGLNLAERIAALDKGLSQPPDSEPVELEHYFPDPGQRREALKLLVTLSMADGTVHPAEEVFIKNMATRLQVPAEELDGMRAQVEEGV